jgi:hypothetical protein
MPDLADFHNVAYFIREKNDNIITYSNHKEKGK